MYLSYLWILTQIWSQFIKRATLWLISIFKISFAYKQISVRMQNDNLDDQLSLHIEDSSKQIDKPSAELRAAMGFHFD